MIITRTPFRVSFTGGGSDLREYYARSGRGAVLSTSINKYMYIVIHPYFHDKIRLKYSLTEDVDSVDEIQHPIVRECLRKVAVERGIEIASFADIPSGTGLGSSSSFTVGLLNALYAYKGRVVSKERLAAEACEIEIDILGEPIGKQDQYAAAYGGINHIGFNGDESVDVSPILLTEAARGALEGCLRLYHVGGDRSTRDILTVQKERVRRGVGAGNLDKMVSMTEELRAALAGGDVASIGPILHRGWLMKREMAEGVSNGRIDALYERALACGATGGKLLGAGGTGFLLLCCADHGALESRFGCRSLPFVMDRDGSKIIFYE